MLVVSYARGVVPTAHEDHITECNPGTLNLLLQVGQVWGHVILHDLWDKLPCLTNCLNLVSALAGEWRSELRLLEWISHGNRRPTTEGPEVACMLLLLDQLVLALGLPLLDQLVQPLGFTAFLSSSVTCTSDR